MFLITMYIQHHTGLPLQYLPVCQRPVSGQSNHCTFSDQGQVTEVMNDWLGLFHLTSKTMHLYHCNNMFITGTYFTFFSSG